MIKINLAKRRINIYANRIVLYHFKNKMVLNRANVYASVNVNNSGANQLRSMLGLNLQVNSVKIDAEVFLPLITIDEALPAGFMPWNNKGSFMPK